MSGEVGSHLTSDINGSDDDISKDLMAFCIQLVHHSQWTLARWFLSGSRVENPLSNVISQVLEVNRDGLDIDRMTYKSSNYAFNRSVVLPESYNGSIVRIYTDEVHTGYVRLIEENGSIEFLPCDWYALNEGDTIHGPAVLSLNERLILGKPYALSNISEDTSRLNVLTIKSHDVVFAVHSPYWPMEATEWITRRRRHGFPSKSAIIQIVKYECDIVQVSHTLSEDKNEWRFSFSKAELFIAQSWTESQLIVYNTMWVLNKRIASRNLCTYYFKTLLFWACEEKPIEFFRHDLLVQSVSELLIEMLKWVKSRFCLNYFIPGNNMMDHLIDKDLSYELDALWRALQSKQNIANIIDTYRKYDTLYTNRSYHIVSPDWVIRTFVICWRVNNFIDNYGDLFFTNLTADLQSALFVELSDIYRGLCYHQKSVRCVNAADKYIFIEKSRCSLLLAVNLCESPVRDEIHNCSLQFVETMMAKFHNTKFDTEPRSRADRQNSSSCLNKQKSLLYGRSVKKRENKVDNNYSSEKTIGSRNVKIVLRKVAKMYSHTNAQTFREWPGRSPTVNISWFIGKAYLANLYYTTNLPVSLTINSCNDIIDTYRQSHMNEESAERIFPVVLSTQWTNIYDDEIQQLLGFHSLCSYVLGESNCRSVYLGVCPVQFALYLRVRTAMRAHRLSDVTNNTYQTINKYGCEYFTHITSCKCDVNVCNGTLAISRIVSRVKKAMLNS